MHGLAGSSESPFNRRLTGKLVDRGVRVFGFDFRNCGPSLGLSKQPYHAGCSQDLAAVIAAVLRPTADGTMIVPPPNQLTLIGVSLSANVLLKYLGETGSALPTACNKAIAVSPPMDLKRCVLELERPQNWLYHRHFTKYMLRQLAAQQQSRADTPPPIWSRLPRTVYEFDQGYTAPVTGYRSADHYYAECSSAPLLPRISLPTDIIAAADDPFVPLGLFDERVKSASRSLQFTVAPGGGHLGYYSRSNGVDPDNHWLDWRIVEKVAM